MPHAQFVMHPRKANMELVAQGFVHLERQTHQQENPQSTEGRGGVMCPHLMTPPTIMAIRHLRFITLAIISQKMHRKNVCHPPQSLDSMLRQPVQFFMAVWIRSL